MVYDFLPILQGELVALGLRYRVVTEQMSSDAEAPSALGFDVRLTQRKRSWSKGALPRMT